MEENKRVEITPELEKRVREFNKELKQAQKDASDAKSAVEYGQKELKRQCDKLTELLGKEVTEENIEQIYDEEMQKLLNDLDNGEKIIKRIKDNIEDDEELTVGDKEELESIAGGKASFQVDREERAEKEEEPENEPVSNSDKGFSFDELDDEPKQKETKKVASAVLDI